MENAYLKRLGQLREQKVESNIRKVQPLMSRPLSRQAPGPARNPNLPPEKPEEIQPDMSSMFGMNIDRFTGEDKRFGEFMKQYTQMANGLRQQVSNGYMPMPIAQQRLEQYLGDSMGYFSQNEAQPMDNPQLAAAIDGLMGQAMQGQLPEQQAGQPVPAQAMTPQQNPNTGGM